MQHTCHLFRGVDETSCSGVTVSVCRRFEFYFVSRSVNKTAMVDTTIIIIIMAEMAVV